MVLSFVTSNMTKDSEEYLEDVSAIRAGNGKGLMGGFLRDKSKPPLRLCTIFTGLFPIESVQQREIQGYKEA